MNNESEILAKLDQIARLQLENQAIMKESQLIQKQAFELQQKAVDNQLRAVQNQLSNGRLYRISLVILIVLILTAAHFLSTL
ncbi:hypothetical protein JIN84_22530 [Luteolibacter yonseiensis]|uniref:Uncharacterized protein n=1 Tax=Luteolibacter yonseiensis TaxID=1144680 RepID=A0A934R7F1_9BACT|nr:hypothetical protein [Luteolibacter yonseiensis]MBK1818412.1 hypothetical protein [Luteolibacter yonseiensis]